MRGGEREMERGREREGDGEREMERGRADEDKGKLLCTFV